MTSYPPVSGELLAVEGRRANSYLSLVPINLISVVEIFMYFVKRAANAISVRFNPPIGVLGKRMFLVSRIIWTKFLIFTAANNLKFRLILSRENKITWECNWKDFIKSETLNRYM